MTEWYFSEDDCRLVCPERVVQLTPKAASILACLQRHQGQVVPTKTILEEIWQETHVTPDLVREYIHDLRQALGDDARHPRFIETVRGKGFRLLRGIEPTSGDLTTASPNLVRSTRPIVTVLKPVLSENRELNSIAEEVASEVINHLARFHYIGIVACQSSASPNEVENLRALARDVQANYILDSNYALHRDKVRARIQLIDASTNQSIWGTRIEAPANDISAAVDEICHTIVMALTGWHGELHRAEFKSITSKHVNDLNAFDHFILGCNLEMKLDVDSLLHSLSHLEQSVRMDPNFARAWLVFALELRWAYSVIPGRDRTYLEKSAEAFKTSFNLAPTDPVNLALMAMNTARIGNIEGALTMLRRAEANMGGDSDAMVCVATATSVLTNEAQHAVAIFDSVMEHNNSPPSWVYFAEAGIAFMAGLYERCVASSRSGPQELSALVFRCLALVMLGRKKEALHAQELLLTAFPEFDFINFADNFPITCEERRSSYETALALLREAKDTT